MDEKFQKILQQVKTLYHKYGIKSITMDDVARELGISKKTLYLYVKDKADLVDKVVEMDINSHQCILQDVTFPQMNAIDALIKVSKVLNEQMKNMNPSASYDLRKYYPAIWEKVVDFRRKHVFHQIRENMLQGIKEDLFRPEINADIISYFYVLRIEEVYLESNEEFLKKYPGIEVFNALFDYHIRGIANKKGIEYYENKIKLTD